MSIEQTPGIGRIVHYTLSEQDAQNIAANRASGEGTGNAVKAGDIYPAIITRVWTPETVQLTVFLDGTDTLYGLSKQAGDQQGNWAWPART